MAFNRMPPTSAPRKWQNKLGLALQSRAHRSSSHLPAPYLGLAILERLDYYAYNYNGYAAGPESHTLTPYVMHDAVPAFLKEKGYRYIHIGSWVKLTATNPQADDNVTLGHGISEFSHALLGQTAEHVCQQRDRDRLGHDLAYGGGRNLLEFVQ